MRCIRSYQEFAAVASLEPELTRLSPSRAGESRKFLAVLARPTRQRSKARLHRRDLDLLRRDDLLGKLSSQRVSAMNQHETRHFDSAPVMRDHHRQEIAICVPAHRR